MKQNYLDRAMRARDPRFAKIAKVLGQVADDAPDPEPDDLTELRAEYERAVGKRPFHGWDAETLRAKIAEAEKDAD